ncbi:ribonuclease J [Candidatus Saccharibacteria bacterium]|nr:ribonuclease J [Candidatus Saccharibacteria bacterium]MBI3337838.1 ribonuclease J [Candidatus Saccharibacteria bacterium]
MNPKKNTQDKSHNNIKQVSGPVRSTSRGAAIRAQKRSQDDAHRIASEHKDAETNQLTKRANIVVEDFDKLRISFLGGLFDVGEKNMAVIEYKNDAIILDCGNNLGVDLPGINYAIADPSYLASIKHKIKGYIITHGHLDHIGGLKHIVPRYPAPIYGSRYTIGIVGRTFEEELPGSDGSFELKTVIMNIDNHERLKIGDFIVELVRVTHSIPDASTAVIETPVGRIVATGDFRLDPEPLDDKPSDTARLKQLGDQGVLVLLSDSSYADVEGRTPTEHTLQQSFHDVIAQSQGRIFVASFSSNMNRIQMVINAAVNAGRKVALDGRSMMGYAEVAVRQGILKVPKGMIMAMRDATGIPDDKLLVMCTGGQGEPNAALQRMSEGDHKYIKLKPGDTVVVSSSPIPGNEVRYDMIGNNLAKLGVHLFRHPTHELDGCGPLHVSGHGRRDELREMLHLVRPKFFIPVHAGTLRRRYHGELAIQEGWKRGNVLLPENGDSLLFTDNTCENAGQIPHGSLLVDQTGAVVNNVVIKDRVMLSQEGLVAVVLTVDKKNGNLLTSPDIISRGFIYMRDNEDIMNGLRQELRRASSQRFKRIDLDRFKQEIKEHVTHYLFDQTGRSPIVIPVVNIIGGKGEPKSATSNGTVVSKTSEEIATEQQKRFQELRERLLSQDVRTD